MTYKVEDVKKILEEKEEFDFITSNNYGERMILSANTMVFANWIINVYNTNEFCVAYQEQDIYNVTPISKIIEII